MMRLLDLFCGAGGAAMGYCRAGFEDITGVDIKPMPRYPFNFVQGDALEYLAEHGHEYDVIHASPPCSAYSIAVKNLWGREDQHPDLLLQTRLALERAGKPYVIENVVGAPMRVDLMLCGTMFGLRIIRHRCFEISFPFFTLLPPCNHSDVYDPWNGPGRTAEKFKKAMGIDWMPMGGGRRRGTINQAIPPAYTEFIGKQIMKVVKHEQT